MQLTITSPLIALLPSLYSEYYDLSSKLQKISDLITSYGGEIPVGSIIDVSEQRPTPSPIIPKVVMGSPVSDTLSTGSDYPKSDSWRQKLIHGLANFGKPITAKDLAEYIYEVEGSTNRQHIVNTTAQYLSKLEKEKRINADKSFRPTKYFLNS